MDIEPAALQSLAQHSNQLSYVSTMKAALLRTTIIETAVLNSIEINYCFLVRKIYAKVPYLVWSSINTELSRNTRNGGFKYFHNRNCKKCWSISLNNLQIYFPASTY